MSVYSSEHNGVINDMRTDEHKDYEIRPINPERMAAIQMHAGNSILDIGCGNGAYVLSMRGERDCHGLDFQPYESWNQAPELFSVENIDDLYLKTDEVDTIILFEVLEHLRNPLELLKKCHSAARKNVIVTVPNTHITLGMRRSNLIYYHWIDPTHCNFYDLESIADLVKSAGFAIAESRHINCIDIAPIVLESAGITGFVEKLLRRPTRVLLRRKYPMTCLVVGQIT